MRARGLEPNRALATMLAVLVVITSLGGPLAGSSRAHSPSSPTQPTEWPGFGTQWWDHWWSEAFVARDVGTVSCTSGSIGCAGIYDGDRFSIGVVYWVDYTCYADGCGSMNVEMWQAGLEISGNGINNGATRDDARNHANAGGYYFPPFSHPTPAKSAAVFTYCKWVFVDANGIATGCALNGEPGRVRTSELTNLHFMWAATSGDGSVRGSPRGDFVEVTAPPPGYPAPGVPNDRANYGRRCAVAGASCTVNFGDFGSDKAWTFGASGTFSPDPVNLATGSFTAHADDLTLPGRLIGFAFTRWYNSADNSAGGPLGPGWTHAFNLALTDNAATAVVRRGDGRQDTFSRNVDGSYAGQPGVFDTLVKNVDGSFTLTAPNQIQYELSPAGQLTRIHEPSGNQLTLAYVSGRLATITDTVGRTVSFTYTAQGQLSRLQDPIGRAVTYAYDATGRLVAVTDRIGNTAGQTPSQHQWRYSYDGDSRHLVAITDPDGRVRVTNSYDGQGRVVQQRDGLGALSTFSYSAGQTVLTDPRGHATTYTFDGRLRVLTQADPVGAATYTIAYTYDVSGNRTSTTDRNGNRTDFGYDARGNLLTKTDPSPDGIAPRPVTSFAYDARNNLTRLTDPTGFSTTFGYDGSTNALLSVARQIDAATAATTRYEYTDSTNPGLPTRLTSPRGNTGPLPDPTYATTLAYDPQGNLVRRTDPDGAITTFAYDGVGRLTSFVDPDGNAPGAVQADHTWQVGYDELDREIARADPLGSSIRTSYDGAGDRTAVTDRNGNVTSYGFDPNARLASVQQRPDPVATPALVYTTQVGRDPNGNATRVTQANGVASDYVFDALNRLASVSTHPDATTTLATSYALDANGQPISRTTGDGVTVGYRYDTLSRLVSVSGPGVAIAYSYDPLGRRTAMTDATGSTAYSYDALGRLTALAGPTGTLGYSYDLDSNRTRLEYSATDAVTYAYSPGRRLTTVTDWAARVSTYTYRPSGLVSGLSYPNGMTASYAYDRAQRLTGLTYGLGATIGSERYTLDPEGNRTALSDVFGTTPEVAGTLGYDGLNRLTALERHVVATGFPVSNETFTLDPASNIASRTGPGATFSYDGANRLTGDGTRTFSWDAADRLTARGADQFSYDPLSRLTAATVAGVTRSYGYDGDGLLRSRTEGSATTALLYDASVAPAPLLQAGTERLVYGLGPLYQVHPNGSYDTMVRDGLGSVRLTVSGTGGITGGFDYTAYGAPGSGSFGTALLGYAGELRDPSGLIYLRARWYDPAVGRFNTRDPIAGSPLRPKSLGGYVYAQTNPAVNGDPSGLLCVGLSVGGSGVLGLGPIGAVGTTSIGLVICGGGASGFNIGTVETVGGFAGGPNDPGAIGTTRGNIAAGAYAGLGLAGLVSPNATQVGDLGKAFRSETINLGIGPLNGSVDYSSGRNDAGSTIDVISVTPPFLSGGLGASYSLLTTWSFTQELWSQSASPK